MDEILRFEDQVIAVTGGGNGLGRAYCLELAARGARVIVNDVGASPSGAGRSPAAADAVVEEIRRRGGEALANHDSVTTRAGGRGIIEQALDSYGRLDALISNAGFLTDNPLERLADEQIDAMLDVHLKGAFHVVQPAFAHMQSAGAGRILLTSSGSAFFGHAWHAAYAAAKAALLGLMNAIAIEGRPHGIRCNAILPTARTRLSDAMQPGFMAIESFADSVQRVDFARLGASIDPSFTVPLAVYLVHPGCRSTQGIYSQAGPRYSRVRIGVTEGWLSSPGAPPTVEDIASHWHAICESGSTLHEPRDNYEELRIVADAMR